MRIYKRKNILERIFDRIENELNENECWVPDLAKTIGGYTRISTSHDTYSHAHRVVWEAYNAEPLGDRIVMHSCDNPGCCNPAHLVAGTQTDNMRDCSTKGRWRNHCAAGAAYD